MKTEINESKDQLIIDAVNKLFNKNGQEHALSKSSSKFMLSFYKVKLYFATKFKALKDRIHLMTFSFKYYEGFAHSLLLILYSSLLPSIRAFALSELLSLINTTPVKKRGALLMRYLHIPVITLRDTKFSIGHYLLNALLMARECFCLDDPSSEAFSKSLRAAGLKEDILDSWLNALYPYKSIQDDPHSFIPMMLIDPSKADLLMHSFKKIADVVNSESYLSGITDKVMLMSKASPDIAEAVNITFSLFSSSYLRVPSSPIPGSTHYQQWFNDVQSAVKSGRIFKLKAK